MIQISVVISTHNPREKVFSRILAALQRQTLPVPNWELFVVDNASDFTVADKWKADWHPAAKFLREDKVGKLNAWQLAIPQTRGAVLVFVDDDNELDTDYLEQAWRIGETHPFIGAWGGGITPECEVPPPAWIGDLIGRLTAYEVKADVWGNLREDFSYMPVGAGMCARHDVCLAHMKRLRDNAFFANNFDRVGKHLGGYGDFDLVLTALDLGYGAGQFAKLHLTHLIPASRLTVEHFARHAETDTASLALFRAGRGLKIPTPWQHSWLGRIQWKLHCWKNRMPPERVKVFEAEMRGSQAGWKLAQDFLQKKNAC
jgi:glycosyltransferase involved in cell wall biosynthesis